MILTLRQADHAKRAERLHRVQGDLRDESDVFQRSKTRDQVIELEDKADMLASVAGQARIVGVGKVVIAVHHRPDAGPVQAAEDIEQRRLPASRCTQQDHELATVQVEVHTGKCADLDFTHVVGLADVSQSKQRLPAVRRVADALHCTAA
ncbi:hypothetical protein D3C81_1465670 [compost metagenome]